MTRVVAACLPSSDAGFGERVRHVIDQGRWDLGSPEGIRLVQAVLRRSYPMATVVGHGGVWSGGVRRTVLLDVYRDGTPDAARDAMRWIGAVYDLGGPSAFRAAFRILGDGAASEEVVERAFRQIRPLGAAGVSIAVGVAALETAAVTIGRAALAARAPVAGDVPTIAPQAATALAGASLRKGPVRRALNGDALASVTSSQREALELSLLGDLKVGAIADRMQITPAGVNRELNDALLAVSARAPLSVATTLARWREAERGWADLPASHPARPARSVDVAHSWIDYQVASHAIPPHTVALVTDDSRRFVTSTANAGALLGRPSVVGLHIDDITAEYARPFVPELWTVFDVDGSMAGDYDCDRPDLPPVRVPFRGIWGRPIPDLQVGYLGLPREVPTG